MKRIIRFKHLKPTAQTNPNEALDALQMDGFFTLYGAQAVRRNSDILIVITKVKTFTSKWANEPLITIWGYDVGQSWTWCGVYKMDGSKYSEESYYKSPYRIDDKYILKLFTDYPPTEEL